MKESSLKDRKDWFEPALYYTYTPFPHSCHIVFYLPIFNSGAKKILLGSKNIGGPFALPPPPLLSPQFTPIRLRIHSEKNELLIKYGR
jgi:hypothetical protein